MPPKKRTIINACGSCSNEVAKNTKGLRCSLCQKWFHSRCLNLNNEEFNVIANNIKRKVPWRCVECSVLEVSVRNSNSDSEEDSGDEDDDQGSFERVLKEQFREFSKKFDDKFDNFKKSIGTSIAELRKEVSDLAKQNAKTEKKCSNLVDRISSVEVMLNSFESSKSLDLIIQELNERKRRESNVIALG